MKKFDFLIEQIILEKLIKILGPALFYRPDKVIVRGSIGTSHMMLYDKLNKALAQKKNISIDRAEDIIGVASDKELTAGFITSEGKFVNREQAWQIAKNYKKNVQTMDAQGVRPQMASEYL